MGRGVNRPVLSRFLLNLFSAGRRVAVRRCSCTYQHRAPRLRLLYSWTAATRHRLATPAPFVDNPVPIFELDVAHGAGRIDSVHGRLRRWRGRDFETGAGGPRLPF